MGVVRLGRTGVPNKPAAACGEKLRQIQPLEKRNTVANHVTGDQTCQSVLRVPYSKHPCLDRLKTSEGKKETTRTALHGASNHWSCRMLPECLP